MSNVVSADAGLGALHSQRGSRRGDGPIARIALGRADLMAAGRLRYDAYIAEQGKPYPAADHVNRVLVDELDDEATVILVTKKDVPVGTVRANWLSSPIAAQQYSAILGCDGFSRIDAEQISVCSRLVSRDVRDVKVRRLLFERIFEIGLRRETRLCFVTCAPIVLRLFQRYGYREYSAPIVDPIVGLLHRTVLVLDDLDHLSRVKSPFFDVAKHNGVEHCSRAWLDEIFKRTTSDRKI